jgi:DNA-binding transcriptional LysR family regulator
MQWSERIGRRLKLRDLHFFMAVADRKNMAKAADSLSVSRPVVSKTIADLESTLGVRLVDRTKKGVEITPCGYALLKWSVAVFDNLRQSVNEIEHLADPTAGELRIGCSEAVMIGLLPTIIDRLHRRHSKLVFHVVSALSGERLLRMLRERDVDVIFGRVTLPSTDEDLTIDTLFDFAPVVVAGAKSKWAKRRRVELAELVNENWVLFDPASAAALIHERMFQAAGLQVPQAAVTCGSVQMSTALAATGRYLTICNATTLRFSAGRLGVKALPVDLPELSGALGIVTLRGRTISPVAELFIRCAREVVEPLAGGRRAARR